MNEQPPNDPQFVYLDEYGDEPTPFWTRRRIVLTLFAIIIVVTLLAYSYSGLFIPPPPPPTLEPGTLV